MSDENASRAREAEAALARVRALLVDPLRQHSCLCGVDSMIRPDDLAQALKGAR